MVKPPKDLEGPQVVHDILSQSDRKVTRCSGAFVNVQHGLINIDRFEGVAWATESLKGNATAEFAERLPLSLGLHAERNATTNILNGEHNFPLEFIVRWAYLIGRQHELIHHRPVSEAHVLGDQYNQGLRLQGLLSDSPQQSSVNHIGNCSNRYDPSEDYVFPISGEMPPLGERSCVPPCYGFGILVIALYCSIAGIAHLSSSEGNPLVGLAFLLVMVVLTHVAISLIEFASPTALFSVLYGSSSASVAQPCACPLLIEAQLQCA